MGLIHWRKWPCIFLHCKLKHVKQGRRFSSLRSKSNGPFFHCISKYSCQNTANMSDSNLQWLLLLDYDWLHNFNYIMNSYSHNKYMHTICLRAMEWINIIIAVPHFTSVYSLWQNSLMACLCLNSDLVFLYCTDRAYYMH